MTKQPEQKEAHFVSLILKAIMIDNEFIVEVDDTKVPLSHILANLRLGGAELTPLGTAYDPRPTSNVVMTSIYVLMRADSAANKYYQGLHGAKKTGTAEQPGQP